MKGRSRTAFVISFLAPAAVLYGVFVCLPVFRAFEFSTYRWRGVSQNREFVGIENFGRLAKDDVFWQSLGHNLWILAVGGLAMLGVGLLLAHAVQGEGRAMRALRGIYLFPHIVSLVVVAILWQFIYNPTLGLLTKGLEAAGLERFAVTWLADGRTALPAVTVAFIWYGLGFYIMLIAAGLKGIPDEVKEAARLDGADGLKRFWTVTWPLLWSIKRISVIHIVISTLNIFALVFLMTRGGPDRKTEVMLTYLYEQAFVNSEFGYSTALAVANFAAVAILAALVMLWFRRDPTEARK
jgi:N-acetylglucosamine transport system permease protein